MTDDVRRLIKVKRKMRRNIIALTFSATTTTTTMKIDGYLGIDIGTQGLTVVFTDTTLKVIATGESSYDFVPGLDEGCYEQRAEDWRRALQLAMQQVHEQLKHSFNVLSIGIAGQMHGEVLCDERGACLSPVRLWCDIRNGEEGDELTNLFGCKVAHRATAARFLWTTRNRTDQARKTRHLTTPSGWLAFELTGEFNSGVGNASGMFPIDPTTLNYDEKLLQVFDEIVGDQSIPSLNSLLPNVLVAGKDAGKLSPSGAALLGLPEGIPVAPAEGDQVAALAGGLIGEPGMVSCSFGTSVCANTVGDHPFQGVAPAIDQFCAADGRPISMVCLRNGTTFLSTMVKSYGSVVNSTTDSMEAAFTAIMPQIIAAPDDCGGIIALPFLDNEPGLDVPRGNSACFIGLNHMNATPGNLCKASLLCVMFNLRLGQQLLDEQGFQRKELNLSGGLCKTPECGYMLANVFNTSVVVYESAHEGCSWGAAILAKYLTATGEMNWPTFLQSIAKTVPSQRMEPDEDSVTVYNGMFDKYKKLMALQPALSKIT
jgi:sugar (pentulose or hexulose) kinase